MFVKSINLIEKLILRIKQYHYIQITSSSPDTIFLRLFLLYPYDNNWYAANSRLGTLGDYHLNTDPGYQDTADTMLEFSNSVFLPLFSWKEALRLLKTQLRSSKTSETKVAQRLLLFTSRTTPIINSEYTNWHN